MGSVTLTGVGKVYPDGNRALKGLDLEILDGEFIVFVGPSGCGKTTALRMIAGLEEVSEGEIKIDDQVMNLVEPRKRDIAMVFQNYALYPHMSVFQNIAFPLQNLKLSRSGIDARVRATAERLGLTELLQRRPRTLSGGQRQRVAMGRAIIREPRVFLMDEPLSNLDAKLRAQMRTEISEIQRELGTTTIYVTHDQIEALTMGTRIVVMRRGLLQQEGPPQEVYEHPANLFVASFLGSPSMNLFAARLEDADGALCCAFGDQRLVVSPPVRARHPRLDAFIGREIAIGIRPEHVSDPAFDRGGTSRIAGVVKLVEALGSERLVHVSLDADPVVTEEVLDVARDTDVAVVQALEAESRTHHASLVARVDIRSEIRAGERIELAVDGEHLHFFDPATGQAIV